MTDMPEEISVARFVKPWGKNGTKKRLKIVEHLSGETYVRKDLSTKPHTVTCECGRKFTTKQKLTMDAGDKLDDIIDKLETVLK